MTARALQLLGLVALPATLAASPARQSFADRSPTVTAPVDPSRVDQLMAKAEAATNAGKVNEARKLYRQVVDEQRQSDEYAGAALWQLALNYYYADDRRRAAGVLDELAADANRFGHPSMELKASFEAAVLWDALQRRDLVAPRLARAKALLQSPAIAEADKAAIRFRMG